MITPPRQLQDIVANHNVMCNLALVVYDNTVTNNGVVKRTADQMVQAPISTRSPIITRPRLRDLNPVTPIVGVTKSVRTDHRAGLNETIVPNLNLMVDRDIGPPDETLRQFSYFFQTKQPGPITTLSPKTTPDSVDGVCAD